jgi:DNA-cytosine methyltransferase
MNTQEGIVVLSLFDGMSCGQIALERLGVKVKAYYASEIDKFAIKVAKKNYPNTIHIGDVCQVRASDLPKIDLLIGGSPCQGFSFAGKQLAFDDPRSRLFFEFLRLKNECNPTFYMLENVPMKKHFEHIISRYLGVAPIEICSSRVSAQKRERLYWTNIANEPYGLFGFMRCAIPQPKDRGILLRDVLEPNAPEKYCLSEKMLQYFSNRAANFNKGVVNIRDINGKASCVTASSSSCDISDNFIALDTGLKKLRDQSKARCLTVGGNSGGAHSDMIIISEIMGNKANTLTPDAYLATGQRNRDEQGRAVLTSICDRRLRRLTPTECERLQTVPDGYTAGVSDTQRYNMLGNGWTVDVIAHILSYADFKKNCPTS